MNVNSIRLISDQGSLESLKMEKLKRLIIKESVDYAALTEVNKNWSAVSQEHTIWTDRYSRIVLALSSTSSMESE